MARRPQEKAVATLRWPQTVEDVAAVRAQLERLLADPLFNQSRRYPSLLRHIVEASLAGEFDGLKERILGIEVFERVPDYDTNADAIVRVTAAEIRKRIAQYYHDDHHQFEPRIDLPVGGYVAEFSPASTERVSNDTPPAQAQTTEVELETIHPLAEKQVVPRPRRKWKAIVIACTLLLALLGTAVFWIRTPRQDPMEEFWRPFLTGQGSPLICVGQIPNYAPPQGPQDSLARHLLNQKPVSISDSVVVSDFAVFMGIRGGRPRILVSTEASYADLRRTPVLLVGGLDNNWTMRFQDDLRFRMQSEPNSGVSQIYDSTNPSSNWKIDFAMKAERVTEDYAIVSRFYSPSTESTVIIAAGLGENGTAAAADFLLHPDYLQSIDTQLPQRWKKQNVELVLKTQIIDGNQGPPVIVARYFW